MSGVAGIFFPESAQYVQIVGQGIATDVFPGGSQGFFSGGAQHLQATP